MKFKNLIFRIKVMENIIFFDSDDGHDTKKLISNWFNLKLEPKNNFVSEEKRNLKHTKQKTKGIDHPPNKQEVHNKTEEEENLNQDMSNNYFKIVIDKVVPLKQWEEKYIKNDVEYKLKLINLNTKRIKQRTTQMLFRLKEGNGKCFYIIGIEENGNPLGLNEEELKGTLNNLYYMTQKIGAIMKVLNYYQGKQGLLAEILITHQHEIRAKVRSRSA
jgi:hypothetical protein